MSLSFKERGELSPPNMTKIKSEQQTKPGLAEWLTYPGAEQYFGAPTMLRLDVLACVVGQGSLAAVARRYGVSRQYAHRHAKAARKAFGIL